MVGRLCPWVHNLVILKVRSWSGTAGMGDVRVFYFSYEERILNHMNISSSVQPYKLASRITFPGLRALDLFLLMLALVSKAAPPDLLMMF